MKKIFLALLLAGVVCLSGIAQTHTTSQPNIITGESVKSKKLTQPETGLPDKNISSDSLKSENNKEVKGVQYLEYKTSQGGNGLSSIQDNNRSDAPIIITPIPAEGYTDPNYESNKQKATDLVRQLESLPVREKTNEELISDLQDRIKAIEDGVVTDANAIQKLPSYKEELQLLLNKK